MSTSSASHLYGCWSKSLLIECSRSWKEDLRSLPCLRASSVMRSSTQPPHASLFCLRSCWNRNLSLGRYVIGKEFEWFRTLFLFLLLKSNLTVMITTITIHSFVWCKNRESKCIAWELRITELYSDQFLFECWFDEEGFWITQSMTPEGQCRS